MGDHLSGVIAMPTYLSLAMLSFRDAIVVDILCALIVHLVYKSQDLAVATFSGSFILLGVVPCFPAYLLSSHFSSFPLAIFVSFCIFYGTLLSSIITYRLSPFHPLSKYPGPLLAKVSKIWGTFVMSQGKSHVYLKDLHAKYGPYVRIGPNELSVTDVNAIPDILGANGMAKGPMWDARRESDAPRNLISIRNLHEHARQRKPWNRAFSTESIKDFEPLLTRRVSQLADELKKRSSPKYDGGTNSVNLAEWIGYFAFDFMGDMAFGGGFEMMKDGCDKTGFSGTRARIGTMLSQLPWASQFILQLPLIMNNTKFRRRFGWEHARKRKENGSTIKDLYYYLLDEAGVAKEHLSDQEILSNGSLIIVAGSDTTSTVLSELFFFLLSHPAYYERLREEVDAAFPLDEGDPFDSSKLAKDMPFLNAVINETLRLGPPLPIQLQRAPEKGSGGKWIGNEFLPEGTAVNVPPYAMHRDPRYFSPFTNEFMPERWLHVSGDSSVDSGNAAAGKTCNSGIIFKTETAAFNPFSYGPANCVGRNLALLEMRTVVAMLMQRFEMRFAPGYDAREWEEKLENFFLMMTGPLPVVLTSRL